MNHEQRKENEYTAKNILGFSPCLGSKSAYRENYPEKDPIFNATIMAQDSNGELYKIWYGDIELTNNETLDKLKLLSELLNSDLYLYRESTINNETFNGRRFPYEHYSARVDKYQKKVLKK